MYAQLPDLVKIFGIKQTTARDIIKHMRADPSFKAGEDYIDYSYKLKTYKIEAFKKAFASFHMKYLKQ